MQSTRLDSQLQSSGNFAQSAETEVLIIGAGPAGAIAASMLHKAGLQVKVIERERFPRFVIGESLLPRCMEVLEEAGLLEAIEAEGFQRKAGAKFMKGNAVSDFNFAEQFTNGWSWTWQVPRAEFDQVLAQEVMRKGVSIDFEATVTAIDFFEDESSIITVQRGDGTTEKIRSKFIVDASGYGRVIPRLLGLDRPSKLDPRKAVFAHVKDDHRKDFDEPDRIVVVLYQPGVWVWIIPFSSGITSLGFVGSYDFFSRLEGEIHEQFKTLINDNPYLRQRFGDMAWIFEPKKLEAWSATTDKFFGKGYVLTGNVTEFLDPIFSSGVMFAAVSGHLASKLIIKKFRGEAVNWEHEYSKVIQQGVDTFRTYVMSWYDGTLEKIFFAKKPDIEIKRQICSVLAGYVWDQHNPYVRDHERALKRLAKLLDIQNRLETAR